MYKLGFGVEGKLNMIVLLLSGCLVLLVKLVLL